MDFVPPVIPQRLPPESADSFVLFDIIEYVNDILDNFGPARVKPADENTLGLIWRWRNDNNIPEGTKLLGARVANKTATLNFSESFSFNKYGVQGYLGQLMQIVYTATSFSTIDNVQFLIEGQKLEYLGGEGVWIGSPLSRISFK